MGLLDGCVIPPRASVRIIIFTYCVIYYHSNSYEQQVQDVVDHLREGLGSKAYIMDDMKIQHLTMWLCFLSDCQMKRASDKKKKKSKKKRKRKDVVETKFEIPEDGTQCSRMLERIFNCIPEILRLSPYHHTLKNCDLHHSLMSSNITKHFARTQVQLS